MHDISIPLFLFSFFIFIHSSSSRLSELGNRRDHENRTVLSKIFRTGFTNVRGCAEGSVIEVSPLERTWTCLATYKHFSTWHVYVTLMVNRATGKRQFILEPVENFLSSSGPDRRVNGRWCTFCLSFTARAPCTWMTLHCGPIDRSKGDGVVASSVVLSPPRRATA